MSEQPTPGWYADPTARFDHRYWDGDAWTEHVARNGHATTDPLDGGARRDPEAEPGPGAAASGLPSWDTAADQPWHTGSGQTWGSTAGTTPSWQTQASASTRTNTKAILSLVLSIIWFGGLASIPAVILGLVARREIRERPGEGGQGVATAGIIIGVIGVIGAMLLLLAFLSFFAIGGAADLAVGEQR